MAIDPSKIGFSQFVDTFDGQKGTLKEKPSANGSTIYMNDKTFHSCFHNDAEKAEHRDKLKGPVDHVKKSLENEFGERFARRAFGKLAASKGVTPDQIDKLTHKDMAKLKTMTDVAKQHATKQFSKENLDFLEKVTAFEALTDPGEICEAFKALYEGMMASSNDCYQFGIDNYERGELNIGHDNQVDAFAVYDEVRGIQPPAAPSAQQVARMKQVVDSSANQIRGVANSMNTRLASDASWTGMKL